MKVLVLSSHTPSLLWFRMDMMKSMVKRGYEVIAAAQMDESEYKEVFHKEGITYKQIYVERNGINPMHDLRTMKSIYKLIKNVKPNKIFVYQAKTIIYGSIAASVCGINEVYPLVAGVGSVFMDGGFKNRLVRCVLKIQYRFALKKSKKIFFQNKDDYELFKNNKLIGNKDCVFLHGSGVNLDVYKYKKITAHESILYIGRLVRDKGIMEYLEACRILKSKHPQLRCMLVGPLDSNPSAINRDDLMRYIDDGVIEYFGEQKDVRPYIEQCTAIVLPSYREGTPKSVLEAMAVGRPVVTTDAPGCRETVIDGYNGYLTQVKNIKDTVNKIEKLLYKSDIDAMSLNSRKLCEELFDVNKVNKTIIETMEM